MADDEAPKYAFKCRWCGNLEDAGNAGSLDRPAACRICGHGVAFDPVTGIKSLDPDNWIVLADLKGDELQDVLSFHGIKPRHIERHTPTGDTAPEGREPRHVRRDAVEGAAAIDNAGRGVR